MENERVREIADAEPVIVVSGLPRSGTSMMMAMLQAGGLEILHDERRRADHDNPRGYYEYTPVQRTAVDASWVSGAPGRAVKVISFHLLALPDAFRYQVIFMERPLVEIVASQRTMLAHRGHVPNDTDSHFIELYQRHLAQVRESLIGQTHSEVLYTAHRDVLAHPVQQSRRIADFLHRDLDVERMARVVDLALYRQKS